LNFGVFGNFPPVWHQLGEALVLVLDGTVELHDEDGLEHEPPTRACEELHDEGGLEHEPPARACEVRTAGEYVGDTCFFQRHGSLRVERHTASAATQVTLAVFSFVSLQRLADARPDLAVDIVTHAVQRMVQRALKGVLQPPPLKEAAEAMRVAAEAELAAKAAEAMRVAAEAELAAKAAEAMRVAAEADLAAEASAPNDASVAESRAPAAAPGDDGVESEVESERVADTGEDAVGSMEPAAANSAPVVEEEKGDGVSVPAPVLEEEDDGFGSAAPTADALRVDPSSPAPSDEEEEAGAFDSVESIPPSAEEDGFGSAAPTADAMGMDPACAAPPSEEEEEAERLRMEREAVSAAAEAARLEAEAVAVIRAAAEEWAEAAVKDAQVRCSKA
jgi:colicin import membrane protein